MADALGIYLKDVGIEAEMEVIDWARLRDMSRNKNIQCCIWPNISWRPVEEWIRGAYSIRGQGHIFEDEFIDKTYLALTGLSTPKSGSAWPGRLATISMTNSPTCRSSGSTMRWW